MAFSVETLSTEQFSEWDAFLAYTDGDYIFSNTTFAQIVARCFEIPFRIWVVRLNGKIEAGILIYEKTNWKWKRAIVPPSIPYNGLVLSNQVRAKNLARDNQLMKALVSELQKVYLQLQIVQYPNFTDPRLLQWQNWKVNPRFTYLTPPKTFQDSYQSLPKSKRYLVRKAESATEFLSFESSSEMTDLVAASFGRQSKALSPPAPKLCAFLSELHQNQWTKFYGLKGINDDSLQSGVAVLQPSLQCAYHLFAGARKNDVNLYLNMRILDHIYNQDVASYDFCGANIPNIAAFKSILQPRPTPYFFTQYHQNKALSLLAEFR